MPIIRSTLSGSDELVPLTYSIAGNSPHSGKYTADRILVDHPTDQGSRWSAAQNSDQWILLKLDRPAILKTISFGKYYKQHPCNMKDFKLLVGMDEDHLVEVMEAKLKNDPTSETFSVKHSNDAGIVFATRFVKIVPISAHGQSFHTSIWHVNMKGIVDETQVRNIATAYDEYRETVALKHVLKYLRQRRLLSPYQSILERSGLELEHPLITELHENIVLRGDWSAAESLLPRASEAGLFDTYLGECKPQAVWKQLHGLDADGDRPCKRSGHAMCIDENSGIIYLFGGWDGKNALEDFWTYDIKEDTWRVITQATSSEKNGPSARSCHKMMFDSKTGSIYLLGRLNDEDVLQSNENTARSANATTPPVPTSEATISVGIAVDVPPQTTPFCSEFYRYRTRGLDSGKWELLNFDTAIMGGPPLIFDHQMVIDSETQILYISGGRIIDGDWKTSKYSGLYMYNIRLSKWRQIQPQDNAHSSIWARFGHSMVLDPFTRQLFIFGGKRNDTFLMDMYSFNLDTNAATDLPLQNSLGVPNPCFTQRAAIDPALKEIYVFCGLIMKQPQPTNSGPIISSDDAYWVYKYDKQPGTWTLLSPGVKTATSTSETLPRYAHQIVYDSVSKMVYMHGGNAGRMPGIDNGETTPSMAVDGTENEAAVMAPRDCEFRLDDLWSIGFDREKPAEIMRRATYRMRQQQFREMCENEPAVKALNFLQTDVYSVVDDSNPAESELFRSLLTHLLSPSVATVVGPPQSEESWTNEIDNDTIMSNVAEPPPTVRAHATSIGAEVLQAVEDPLEIAMQDNSKGGSLSSARFSERTQVFEELLEFFEPGERQPDASLLDLVS